MDDHRATVAWPRHEACPLCGATTLKDLYCVNSFTVASCPSCSLVFVRERLSEAYLAEYYLAGSGCIYDDVANSSNLDYYFGKLCQATDRFVSKGRLLDVGCNAGQFLDFVGEKWDRYGVDLSQHSVQQAQTKLGDRIHLGTIHSFPGEAGAFDMVTMMDVLDHCLDPRKEMSRVHELLRVGGLVAVKVHNISCLWARWAKDKFYAIMPPCHLFYFNKQTLNRLLAEAGFRIVLTRFIGHRMLLKSVPYRLSRTNRDSLYYKMYQWLDRSRLGMIPVYKNLHDIVTILAVKT